MDYTNQVIEGLLHYFKPALSKDYEKYRNHVYRVFLNCMIIDDEKTNEAKYAITAVFHDIGIWTNNTIDYLPPSIEQAKQYLIKTSKQEWQAEISSMIHWHHKTSTYKGEYEQTVETFRKADWIDVTLGLITYGYDRKKINLNRKQIPNRGFHLFLVKRITANWLKHPLNPLPMFTK